MRISVGQFGPAGRVEDNLAVVGRLAAPAVVLAMATLALGLGGQALWTVTDLAAQGLMDPSRYIEAVLNP